MAKQQDAIENPMNKCPFCSEERVGIQEGRIYFKCGTIFQYSKQTVKVEQSFECQKNSPKVPESLG